MKRQKLKPTDGFGPKEMKRVRQTVRQVWHQCHARKLVVNRCTDEKGWQWCERCKKKTPKITVDHIEPVGEVDSGFLKRMFVPSRKIDGRAHV
jgi:hypothetical protein